MSNELMKKEIREAVEAGERCLISLRTAQEKLNSARKWGIFDLFGGGFFVDLMKHSKINDAASYMKVAKQDFEFFQRELQDVEVPFNLQIEVSGFLSFADFFFDGIVADYLVQTKIADAREQVSDAISRVESLLRQLKNFNGYEE